MTLLAFEFTKQSLYRQYIYVVIISFAKLNYGTIKFKLVKKDRLFAFLSVTIANIQPPACNF